MPHSFAEFYASVLTVPSVLTAYRFFHSLLSTWQIPSDPDGPVPMAPPHYLQAKLMALSFEAAL